MIAIVRKQQWGRERGVATILVTVLLLLVVTLTSFFVARTVLAEQTMLSNQYRSVQADQAALAGLEYALIYLNENHATVADNQILNGTLGNGATYSMQFQFQGSNAHINIQSTGVSGDGTASHIINEQTKSASIQNNATFGLSMKVKGTTNLLGNATVANFDNDNTIQSGGVVSFNGNSNTYLTSGESSNASETKSDVSENNATLAAKTSGELFLDQFGVTLASFEAIADVSFSGSGTTNYKNDLNGLTGQTIWINQNGGVAQLNGNTTIGSAADPVTIVVSEGSMEIEGNTTIYGNIFMENELEMRGNLEVYGMVFVGSSGVLEDDSSILGNAEIYGGLIVADDLTIQGNAYVEYDQSNILSYGSSTTTVYGRVSGSWRDF